MTHNEIRCVQNGCLLDLCWREEITCCSLLRLSQHPGEQADPATAELEDPATPPPPAGPSGKDTTGRPQDAFI